MKARDLTPPVQTSATNVTTATANDAQNGLPFIAFTAMAPVSTIRPVNQEPAPLDPMTDHLKRCMDSVQELAKTIAGAMDAWHGKTDDSSDVHGSFSRLATQVSNLPKELQCVHCSRVVTWSGFKRPKLEPGAAGICICTRESSHNHWGPLDEVLQVPDDLELDMSFGTGTSLPAAGGAMDPSLFKPFEPKSSFGAQYPDVPAKGMQGSHSWVPFPSQPTRAIRSSRFSDGKSPASPPPLAIIHDLHPLIPDLHILIPGQSYSSSVPPELRQALDDYDEKQKAICPFPACGKHFKDLKQHMLTHQNERPEKCHMPTCEYFTKGFARKYDKNRHVLTHYKGILVCGFCVGTTKEFTRADVFKRHLTSVHGVEQTPPSARRRAAHATQPPTGNADGISAPCNICKLVFAGAQKFYEHLDDCVLLEITSTPSQNHASPPSGILYHTIGATRHKFEISDPSDHESELAPHVSASQTPKLQVQCPVIDTFDSFDFGASGSKGMDFAVGSGGPLENFDFDKFLEGNEETSNMTPGVHMSVFDYTDTRSDDDQVLSAGKLSRQGGRKLNSRLSSEARARSSNMRAMKDIDRSPSSGPTRTTFSETLSDQQPLSYSGLPADDQWSQAQVQAWLVEHAFSAEWQAAFSQLEIYGMRFLELGVTGANHDTSFMHRKLLPQVSREHEKAGLTANAAREREAGRTLRRLVKTIVVEAHSHLMHSETDTVALKRACNTAAARQLRAREGERRYEEAQTHERPRSPPSAPVSSSKTQSESVSDSDSDDGLFAIPLGSGPPSTYTSSKRPALGLSTDSWSEFSENVFVQPAKSTKDKSFHAYVPPPPPPERMDTLFSAPILPPPVPGSNRKQRGGRLPKLGLSIPFSPYERHVNQGNSLPKELNKSDLPPLTVPPRTQPPKLSLATPMGNVRTPQESNPQARRKLTLQMPGTRLSTDGGGSQDDDAHSRSNSFGHTTGFGAPNPTTSSYSVNFADTLRKSDIPESQPGSLYSTSMAQSGGIAMERGSSMQETPMRARPVKSYSGHYMTLPPPAEQQPLTSATYIPTADSFGPGVGIPPFVPNAEAQDNERNSTDLGDTGGREQKRPKKKVAKMALGDFLADQCTYLPSHSDAQSSTNLHSAALGSWADEMEDLPPPQATSNASNHHGKVNEVVAFPNSDASTTDSDDVSSVGSKKRKRDPSEHRSGKRPHSEISASLALALSFSKRAVRKSETSSVDDEAADGLEEEMDDATDDATDDAANRSASHNEKHLVSPSPGKSLEELPSLQALLGRWFNSGATATLLETEG